MGSMKSQLSVFSSQIETPAIIKGRSPDLFLEHNESTGKAARHSPETCLATALSIEIVAPVLPSTFLWLNTKSNYWKLVEQGVGGQCPVISVS